MAGGDIVMHTKELHPLGKNYWNAPLTKDMRLLSRVLVCWHLWKGVD
jgi:hypothetical protein